MKSAETASMQQIMNEQNEKHLEHRWQPNTNCGPLSTMTYFIIFFVSSSFFNSNVSLRPSNKIFAMDWNVHKLEMERRYSDNLIKKTNANGGKTKEVGWKKIDDKKILVDRQGKGNKLTIKKINEKKEERIRKKTQQYRGTKRVRKRGVTRFTYKGQGKLICLSFAIYPSSQQYDVKHTFNIQRLTRTHTENSILI